SETTSSKDFDADRNIELYPNPFTNQLQIHYTAAKSEDILLSIKDVHGKTVDNRYLKAKSGLNNYDWQPVRTLTGGVYFISIASKEGTFSQKVLYLK
ncbi:MAG TPA: T9SS type A sorting domain-containing protein, partial [Saprospiraceae bacterium]|nr:T9SS type A sorting domain-containing protein [Saprospiraceae bacterium]